MVKRFPYQQVIPLVAIARRYMCTKYEVCMKYEVQYEVHLPSNSKVIDLLLCYNGKKGSIATQNTMDCYYLKEHSYQILSSYTFKCHNYKGTALLPWQQDFHGNKYYSGLLLPQGTCVQNMKFVSLQTA